MRGLRREGGSVRRVWIITAPQWSAGGFIYTTYSAVPARGFCVCAAFPPHIVFIMCDFEIAAAAELRRLDIYNNPPLRRCTTPTTNPPPPNCVDVCSS